MRILLIFLFATTVSAATAEVVPRYIEGKFPNLTTENWKQGFLNVSRTLSCASPTRRPGESGGAAHPRPKDRINRIMLANKKIKQLVGCAEAETASVQCEESTNVAELTPPRGPGPRIAQDRAQLQQQLQTLQASEHDEAACFVRH